MSRRWFERWPKKSEFRKARRRGELKPGAPRPLRLEVLEARVLLTLPTGNASTNSIYIPDTNSDQLYLRTVPDSQHPYDDIQGSIDDSTWQDLGLNTGADATIELGDMQVAHLVGFTGMGNNITFEGAGVSGGAGGQSGSPSDFSIDGDVETNGGNFTVQFVQGIDVSANVVISTRNVGTSTDLISGASLGSSGYIDLTSTNPNILDPIGDVNLEQPHVTLDDGSELLAQSDNSAYASGKVTLDAQNTNYALGAPVGSSLAILVRDSNVNLNGATIVGGAVTIESDAGDQSLLGDLSSLNSTGAAAASILASVATYLGTEVSAPFTIAYKASDASVTLGQGSALDFAPSDVGSSGAITFSSYNALRTGDAVTYSSNGGTAIGGLTSGATYYVIASSSTATSSTQVQLAATLADARAGTPLTGLDTEGAGLSQSLTPDTAIDSSATVTAQSTAAEDADGEAEYFGQLGLGETFGNYGAAIGVGIGEPTATTTVNSNTIITAGQDVNVTSSATSNTQTQAEVEQNAGNGTLLPNPDGTVTPRTQLSVAVGFSEVTAITTVARYSEIDAAGSVAITSTGNNTNESTAETASYSDGTAGADFAINDSHGDVETSVDGTVISGAASPAPGQSGSTLNSASFNPFTDVNTSSASNDPNTIDLGSTDPGFTTGEAVVYDSGSNGPINGLVSGDTYYVDLVATTPDYLIELMNSAADATSGTNPVTFNPYPTLSAGSAAAAPFDEVNPVSETFAAGSAVANNEIDLGTDDGLTTGEPVIYTTDGDAIGGLTSNNTYYVVVVNSTTIELAASYADAIAPNPSVIALDPTQASGSQNIGPTGTEFGIQTAPTVENNQISFGIADGFSTGDSVYYSTTGTPIGGLANGGTYYVVVVDSATIELASSYANATASSPTVIALDGSVATGAQTIEARTPIVFPSAPGYTQGEALVYHQAAGQQINGLTDGDTYYAIVDGGEPDNLGLSLAPNGPPVALGLSPTLTSGTSSFVVDEIDSDSSVLMFDPSANYTFTPGEALQYHAALGTELSGLTDGATYYAITDPAEPDAIQLAANQADAITASDYYAAQSSLANEGVTLSAAAGSYPATVADVDVSTNELLFSAPSPGFTTGEAVIYQATAGAAIGGLTSGDTYYAIPVPDDPNAFQLAATASDAAAGNAISLTDWSTLSGTSPGDTQTLDVLSADTATATDTLNLVPGVLISTDGTTSGDITSVDSNQNAIVFDDTQSAPGFGLGQAVVYQQGSGTAIAGLVNGQTYYAMPIDGNPYEFQLAASQSNASGNLPITLGQLASTVQTGDAFTYRGAFGNGILGLDEGTTYYAIVTTGTGADPENVELASSPANAQAGIAIALSPTLGTASGNQLAIGSYDSTAGALTLADPLSSPLQTGDPVTLHDNGSLVPGLQDGSTYYVVNNQSGGINPVAFSPNVVSTTASGSTISLPGQPFQSGEPVVYNTTGTAIAGLIPGKTYYVIDLGADAIGLAATLADANNGLGLSLGTAVVSGTQTLTLTNPGARAVSFDVSTLFNTGSVPNSLTLPLHGFSTGEAVTYTTDGNAIGGLNPSSTYYVVVVDDNTIQLATSFSNAIATPPVVIPLSPLGAAGAQTFTPVPGGDQTATFEPSAVSVSSNQITLPAHGFVTGEMLTYTNQGSAAIGGLTSGISYYAIVVDANTIQLAATQADAYAGAALSLDGSVAAGDQTLAPSPIALAALTGYASPIFDPGSTITLADVGFVTGEAVTYSTTGTAIGGLASGSTYYVIAVDGNTIRLAATLIQAEEGMGLALDASQATGTQTLAPTNPVIQLAATAADATASAPVVLDLSAEIDFQENDIIPTSGTAHTLTATTVQGVTITAKYQGVDQVETESQLGGGGAISTGISKFKAWCASIAEKKAPSVQSSIDGPAAEAPPEGAVGQAQEEVDAKAQVPDENAAEPEQPSEPSPASQQNSPDLSVAGALGLVYTYETAKAEVEPDAVIEAASDIDVEGTITENQVADVATNITKPADSKTETNVALAFEVGIFNANASALIDSGARLDAADTLTVNANVSYPFATEWANLKSYLGQSGLQELSNLYHFFYGGYRLIGDVSSSQTAQGASEAQSQLGVAGSFSVNVFENHATATIGSGASINQGSAYQTSTQSVTVSATSSVDAVVLAGWSPLEYSEDSGKVAYAASSLGKNNGAAPRSLFPNSSGGGALGISVPVTVIDNTTTAQIAGTAQVRVGPSGSLDVTATDTNFVVDVAITGAKAGTSGFSGSVAYNQLTAHTLAQIGAGTIVTGGGSVTVSANDTTDFINLVGALQAAQQIAVGATAAVNKISRSTIAVIGDEQPTTTSTAPPTGGSTFGTPQVPMGTVMVTSTVTGLLVTSSIAGSVTSSTPSNGPEEPAADLPGGQALDANGNEAPAAGAAGADAQADATEVGQDDELSGATAGAGAGAFGLNLITEDDDQAYINDLGTFRVGNLTVQATNSTKIGGFTGGGAFSMASTKKNIGVAGTYSQNIVDGTVYAYIAYATIDAAAVTISARAAEPGGHHHGRRGGRQRNNQRRRRCPGGRGQYDGERYTSQRYRSLPEQRLGHACRHARSDRDERRPDLGGQRDHRLWRHGRVRSGRQREPGQRRCRRLPERFRCQADLGHAGRECHIAALWVDD